MGLASWLGFSPSPPTGFGVNNAPVRPSYELIPEGLTLDEYLKAVLSQPVEKLWREQPHLRTVVGFVSRNIAHLGIQVFERDDDDGRNRQRDTPLAQLLAEPNADMTQFDLVEATVASRMLYDETYWYVARDLKAPSGWVIRHIPTTWVIGTLGATAFNAQAFKVAVPGSSGRWVEIPSDDMIVFRGWNPVDPTCGVSPVHALKAILAEQVHAQVFRDQMWKRGGRVGNYLSRPAGAPDWGSSAGPNEPSARARFVEQWAAKYSGDTGSNAGGTPLLEDGMELKQTRFSAKDEQFIEASKLSLETCAQVYFINPTMVGILDNANYCLPADALVYTTAGPKRIADVAQDDYVWSLEFGRLVDKRVTWSGQTGVMPLLTIKTQNRTLRCTGNHPVLVRRKVPIRPGVRRYRWEHAYVPAGELRVDDILVTLNELPDTGSDQNPTRTVTEGFAELFGLMIGDGTVCGSVVQIGRAADALYMDHYRQIIREEFWCAAKGGIRTSEERARAVPTLGEEPGMTRFTSKAAAAELASLGFRNGSRTKRVPAWVFGLNPKLRAAFLRGYVDADGSVNKLGRIEFGASSPGLIDDIRHLCIGLGVPVTNISRTDRMTTVPGGRQYRSELWCFIASDPGANRMIGSNDPRYIDRFAANEPWGRRAYHYRERNGKIPIDPPQGCGHARIVSISEELEPVPVYDITVDGEHNFIADGVVVHNSNVREFRKALYGDNLGPEIERVTQRINKKLVPKLADPSRRVYVEFNLQTKLAGSFEEQGALLQTAIGGPYMTRNEGRARLNMPSVDGGDDLIVPLNVTANGDQNPNAAQPPDDENPEPDSTEEPKYNGHNYNHAGRGLHVQI